MRDPPREPGTVRDTWLADALGERYLAYALSTIMRALAAGCARRPEAGAPAPAATRCGS
ncbi:MAG: hypothetical protein ACMVO3_15535 [Thalassobaculum sp.]